MWNRNLETQEARRERVALSKQGLTHLQIDSMFERRHLEAKKELEAKEIAETAQELETVQTELARKKIEVKNAILELLDEDMKAVVEERNTMELIFKYVRQGLDKFKTMIVVFENVESSKNGSIHINIVGSDTFTLDEKKIRMEQGEIITARTYVTRKDNLEDK